MRRTHIENVAPYITKDGSSIRELMHPRLHGVRNQSLAEARVPAGGETMAHRHDITEELYHFLQGHGRMRLGDEVLEVGPGDTVCIPPGVSHSLRNEGQEELVLLCCCAPAYSHDDTVLVDAPLPALENT